MELPCEIQETLKTGPPTSSVVKWRATQDIASFLQPTTPQFK